MDIEDYSFIEMIFLQRMVMFKIHVFLPKGKTTWKVLFAVCQMWDNIFFQMELRLTQAWRALRFQPGSLGIWESSGVMKKSTGWMF